MSLALCLLLTTAPPAAPSSASTTALCERTWAAAAKPSLDETRTCVRHLLSIAYGTNHAPDALELDPPTGTAAALRFPAARLRAMATHVAALCPGGCADLDKHREASRATEWLNGEADARFTLFDAQMMAPIDGLLADVLAGRAVKLEGEWSPLTLWKLRNAVFARHGKRFESPDLTRFFYGPEAAPAPGLPLKASAEAWSDKKLTAQDKKNIAALTAAEKKAR